MVAQRVLRALRSRSPGELVGLIARRVRERVFLSEEHLWYVLELSRATEVPLAEGYEIVLAGESEQRLLSVLGAVSPELAGRRRADGAELWMALRGRDPAFACFVFDSETPVRATRAGVLALPANVICLEDSFTSANHRRKGLAVSAWTRIAVAKRGSGATMITKVETENEPSRRAVLKAGFREAATMSLRRRGPVTRVRMTPLSQTLTAAEREVAAWLERALAR